MARRIEANQIPQGAALLRQGKLVAFPTETVYGLGADAQNPKAVADIFAAKGRPAFNPLIVHIAGLAQAEEIAEFDETARMLAAQFWPGPLTLVLPVRDESGLAPAVTAGLDTVALRVPAHPVARALLEAAGCPVAAPSANPSGRLSPTTAAHVIDGLGDRIAAVIDAGPCAVGLESTILLGTPPTLLRSGGIAPEQIEACLGIKLQKPDKGDEITAPGQLQSHYAPQSALRLNAQTAREQELLIGFGEIAGDLTLSERGDLREAACQLFAVLHAADALAAPAGKTLAVAPVPETGLGLAINDRLRRAAAPRD